MRVTLKKTEMEFLSFPHSKRPEWPLIFDGIRSDTKWQ